MNLNTKANITSKIINIASNTININSKIKKLKISMNQIPANLLLPKMENHHLNS